ncbi:CHAD domain-containing protein [Okibacterium sp. HSC-33S16]|uniref:CYTH and CHAD domain-containing protein n=1 Tax=Okibacterium sp. HSC-33S16 TaxID=2910965 RepID=UPI0020A228BC|nr:CYTH and CHAD domain-containing protein [Okibacterium sp. HSC-33S16]MCP2030978.1 CHAD domain-containing protein [Okibacterium sp. HSC-33S16]
MSESAAPGRAQTEIERKYDVDRNAVVPELIGIAGIASVEVHDPVSLEAVYYDTANNDLARRRIIIRRREGGGDAGWHIKKPAAEGRTELHWPVGEDTGVVPDAVLEPVRACIRDRELTPIARIATRRTAIHLLDAAGVGVVELADDEVEGTDIRNGALRTWREWEVELLSGAPDTEEGRTVLLDQIERMLGAAGVQPSPSVSKMARTLGVDSLTDVPLALDVASDETLNPTDVSGTRADLEPGRVASVVVPAIADLVRALEDADPAARADEPDAVHQMRTTVRRLRSVLAAFRRIFDRSATDDLRSHLKRLGFALGEARDAEVRGLRAAAYLDDLPAQQDDEDARARLVDGAQSEYRQAHDRLRRVLTSSEYFRLLDALDEFVARPPLTEAAAQAPRKAVRKTIAREIRRVRKRADALHADGGDLEVQLHAVRRAARRLRYTAEAVVASADVGSKYARVAEAGELVQDTLGEHRDCVLFAQHLILTSNRADAEGEKTFVYGVLAEVNARKGEEALAESSRAIEAVTGMADRF